MSLTNFWMAAFRLPGSCLKDMEKLCSAFLWSGPELSSRKVKVSWTDLCKPKDEGGIGLRSLKEVNVAMGLKLIWRITSAQSLWVRWIKAYLIRKGSFWSVSTKSLSGSWIWRKILKLREIAKDFHKKEVNNGRDTSFWYDRWMNQGRLKDLLGDRGSIDLGIPDSAMVSDVLRHHRNRRHRVQVLNDIETEIEQLKLRNVEEDDTSLWRCKDNKFKNSFSTKETWQQLRVGNAICVWSKCVWFTNCTPKYSFLLWVTMLNRLSTGDRMQRWNANVDPQCVLCSSELETRKHLFFSCRYTRQIWEHLTIGLLQQDYTEDWDRLVTLLSSSQYSITKMFLARYTFQTAVHSIWRERNNMRHGQEHQPYQTILRFIDKAVRNKISALRLDGRLDYVDGLQLWFGTRPQASHTNRTS